MNKNELRIAFEAKYVSPNGLVLTEKISELLDATIEEVLDDTCIINDKPASTMDEYLMCIAFRFTIAIETIQGLLKGVTLHDQKVDQVTIDYRGRKFVYPNPSKKNPHE